MIKIEENVQQACPDLVLKTLQARVNVHDSTAEMWHEINEDIVKLATKYEQGGIAKIPVISQSRAAYRALGKEPARYRLSAEALLRRVVKSKDLYRINNVVDIINWISLTTHFSIGGYDADKIEGDITLRKGLKDEPYEALGRGQLNIENLPVLADQTGSFGSPTRDSTRTGITEKTQNILFVFFGFGGNAGLDAAVERTRKLLE